LRNSPDGALGGIVLLVCTVAALGWANSPWSDGYFALWRTQIDVGPASHPLRLSLRDWINDGPHGRLLPARRPSR
jgi:NhaA family Na+:H+ antiporter